jgi:hypothetical protein
MSRVRGEVRTSARDCARDRVAFDDGACSTVLAYSMNDGIALDGSMNDDADVGDD